MNNAPPVRKSSEGPTLPQQYALDAVKAEGKITHGQVAKSIGLKRAAISMRLLRYRRKLGLPTTRPRFQAVRLVSLSLFAI